MKKIVYLLLVAVCGLIANPLIPGLDITELKFDSQNNWQLEIRKMHYLNYQGIDSLVISTSSGSSKIKNSTYINDSLYFVIENSTACLTKPLEINASGDHIQLTSYYTGQGGQPQTTNLDCGSNSPFADLKPDQSIAFIEGSDFPVYGYALDNSPNLGGKNGADGAVGQLSGLLTDHIGNPLANARFNTSAFSTITDNSGIFKVNLLAKRHSISYLNLTSPYISTTKYIPEILMRIKADSLQTQNLKLASAAIEEASSNTKSPALLYNYPNPFNNQTAIYYEVPEGVKYNNASIRISNIKGESVAVLAANQKSGSVYWNTDHNAAGMYIYQLLIDGKAVSRGEMVLLK